MTDQRAKIAALTALAMHGVEPDIQDILTAGNPARGIKPGALDAAIAANNLRDCMWKPALPPPRSPFSPPCCGR